MASESVNNSGFVVAGTNLQQNVLLARNSASVVNSAKIDLSAIDNEKVQSENYGFWQSVINFRENLLKNNKNVACVDRKSEKCNENLKNIALTTSRHKSQIDDKNLGAPHNIEDAGDCISELIGHIGRWQLVWVLFLILFQVPSAFHIFSFMFQVGTFLFYWNRWWISSFSEI